MQTQQNTECLIEKSIARTLYIYTLFDLIEEISEPVSMGQSYYELAGETPSTFKLETARLVGMLEQVNGKSIDKLYSDAITADNKVDNPELRDSFGYDLAMEVLSGVSFFGNHERFELMFPFYYEVQAATINKQALLDFPGFDESTLKEDQKIRFKNLTSKDAPHAIYHRPAVGIAKAMILDAYAGRLEEREAQKNLLVSEIAKNEALILQGYRLLGAMEAINRHNVSRRLLVSYKDDRREETDYTLNKQDLENYRAIAHEDIAYLSERMMGSLVNDIQTGQIIYEFFAKNRPIYGFDKLIKPSIKLDTSMIKPLRLLP
ncbi:hypothetical protein ACI2KR_07890 [Pseudomonas luteola]